MTPSENSGYLHSLVAGLGAALLAIGTWAWNMTHKRIDTTVMKDLFDAHIKNDEKELKGIHDEITLQRGNIAEVFDRIDALSDETQTRFTVNDKQAFERHLQLLEAIRESKK